MLWYQLQFPWNSRHVITHTYTGKQSVVKAAAGPLPPEALKEMPSLSLPALVAVSFPRLPWLAVTSFQSHPPFPWRRLHPVSLKRTHVTDFRAQPHLFISRSLTQKAYLWRFPIRSLSQVLGSRIWTCLWGAHFSIHCSTSNTDLQ